MTETDNTSKTSQTATETKKKTKKEEKTFESALARLNEIVSALETGSAPLDKSLALYEEGISGYETAEGDYGLYVVKFWGDTS